MWPEYRERSLIYENKKLLLYDSIKRRLYDQKGKICANVSDAEDLQNILFRQNALAFTGNLTAPGIYPFVSAWADVPNNTVLASRRGVPIACRFQLGNHSRWLSKFENWDLTDDINSLKILDQTFKHIKLGSAPTPSSLGRRSMRWIYTMHKLIGHTALPLSCEDYIHRNGFGGIVVTRNIGEEIPVVSQLDSSSHYVSVYDLHPSGTASYFRYVGNLNIYATWFAECTVTIRNQLALGVFPTRDSRGRVNYPVRKGFYRTHLWKETAELAIQAGCDVVVHEGWGWPSMTEDNQLWAEWIYSKRLSAPSKDVEKRVKKVAVSAIGSHGRAREQHVLVGPSKYSPATDFPVMQVYDPVDLWVHPSSDNRSATMVHWNDFTIARANGVVRKFASSFAEQGRLVLIDYDSVFTRGEEEGGKFIHKNSAESLVCKPGTWIWKLHHKFKVLRNRMWISEEEPLRYGSLLERVS